MTKQTSIPFAFFGTPEVASRTLERLIEHGYIPSLVVTAEDKPQGRGLTLTPTPVRVLAERHDIPVITPKKLDAESVASIESAGCVYAVVVAYGKILPEALLEIFPKGVLNVHYSLLPQYRGASPVEAALLAGDTVTGVTLQKMVYELDAGAIVAAAELPILTTDTALELRPKLIELGAELLTHSLPGYLSGELELKEQNHCQATRCGKIAKSERELSLQDDPEQNWRRYRALAEGPGTHFYAERNGKRFRVKIRSALYENRAFKPLRVIPEGKQEQDYETLLISGASPL